MSKEDLNRVYVLRCVLTVAGPVEGLSQLSSSD